MRDREREREVGVYRSLLMTLTKCVCMLVSKLVATLIMHLLIIIIKKKDIKKIKLEFTFNKIFL